MGEREREMEGEKGRGHSRGRASRLKAAYCHGAQKGECNCDCDADCDWWLRLRLVTGMWLGLKLWPLSNELNEYVQRSSLSSVPHIQDTYASQPLCVCVYIYWIHVRYCIRILCLHALKLASPSSVPCLRPPALAYFSGIFTCCRRVVQRKLMPLVYVCVYLQLCISSVCIFLSCILRESVFFAIVQIIQRRRHQGVPTTFVTICTTQRAAILPPLFPLPQLPLATVLLH